MIVTISGKMYAGKDTLADGLCLDSKVSVHRFTFSDLLRAEGTAAVDVLRASPRRDSETVRAVADALGPFAAHADEFVAALERDVTKPGFSLASRTTNTRFVLQAMGSDWAPTPTYWAEKALATAQQHEREAGLVLMVGTRFQTEHDLFTNQGALTVRLDVSRDEQMARALRRDGIIPSATQLDHPGEVALDEADFGLRISSDHHEPEDIQMIVKAALMNG